MRKVVSTGAPCVALEALQHEPGPVGRIHWRTHTGATGCGGWIPLDAALRTAEETARPRPRGRTPAVLSWVEPAFVG
jgi:hypothetical protein